MSVQTCVLPEVFRPADDIQRVRIGSHLDGGYVFNAAALQPGTGILTFGLGLNWDFEADFRQIVGDCDIDCYDHTITQPFLRRLLIKSILKFPFKTQKRRTAIRQAFAYKEFFGPDGLATHYQMAVGTRDSDNETTVGSAFKRMKDRGDRYLLKCDIEGGEYAVLNDILAHRDVCTAIAVEFHDCWDHTREIMAFMEAMLKTHRVDHFAINNCGIINGDGIPQYIELTFSRHDLTEPDLDQPVQDRLKGRIETDWRLLTTPNDDRRPVLEPTFGESGFADAWTAHAGQ